MKHTQQKPKVKGKKTAFILGLPFTLLAIAGGISLVINGIHNFAVSTSYRSENTAMLVGGICMAILGILHFRSGVFMTICGIVISIGMTVALVFILSEYIADGRFIVDGKLDGNAIAGFLTFAACIAIGILELIGGIISIRTVKKLRKVSPWIRKHKKPIDFLKDGLSTSETIIEANYSKAFYDKNNLNVFKAVFPDATVLYRQQAVLRIENRLFVAGNDLSENADPELTFFFEVVAGNGSEKLVPVFSGTEEHSLLTNKYYKLMGYVAPDTAQNGAIGANVGTANGGATSASGNAHASSVSFTRDKLSEKAKKVIMIIIFALYGVTLVLGILTATTGMLDGALS